MDATLFEQRGTNAGLRVAARNQYIKYMGSKASILDWVVDGISEVYEGGGVCDLFSGSSILSAAIGRQVPVYSNDIQHYSRTLAGLYLTAWQTPRTPNANELLSEAEKLVRQRTDLIPETLRYRAGLTLKEFHAIEEANRGLIDEHFSHRWHYFLRVYSGTWWSAEQCLWIDAMRQVIERHRDQPCFDLMMVCLMHAMAYTSQGTGHYAQYRDAKTASSLRDIMTYRTRDPRPYFERKYTATRPTLPRAAPTLNHEITALDFRERLKTLPPCTVYADPPYCFVHYSRFYHALETVYLYDKPELQVKGGSIVKGRYREERHQSPFCIGSQVSQAFQELFRGVQDSESNLVLSYCNTGMISLEELEDLANQIFDDYEIQILLSDHRHMTMGRRQDRDREVKECLIQAKRCR
ncbi:MAG: adenine-specific DNA-methyltransferase [Planctomycetaceae bacterium]|jgi:adenine-specific DNA-methyltransferase